MSRPFYTTYAWAYDLLTHGPVKERVDFIVAQLGKRGVAEGATLLDAGCGTGTYAITLAERGFAVVGMDVSVDLIAEARTKCAEVGLTIDFMVCDILDLPKDLTVDAILCRGVLNDLTETECRRRLFSSLAGALRDGGVLILDVREWRSTLARKTADPVFEKTVMTDNGLLAFRSVTRLRRRTHSLLVSETHVLESPGGRDVAAFEFEMRCWTRKELADHLAAGGFEAVEFFGDYDSMSPAGATDRITAVATLSKK